MAMQGPMNTILRSGPSLACSTRAMASMGDTMGASRSSISGWYLRTKLTTAGQAVPT